ncbi:ORF V: Enzymatic polyprotein [Labeo rohita]|uniref:ORF V: Enzymatic polyprotein n=1 Tax=Labeo rohita TaxID=84645 RepID=A0ABQ8MGX8_LABRO|nr:ORF V: Enzymatic polyprotein [Labeo rohita]
MSMAALKSRRSFMSRHPLLSSCGKSLSRQGFSATTARHLGDIQVTVQNVPSAPKAPRTSASPRGPVELPEQYTSPYSGLGVSFGAPQEIEMSAAASEGEPGGEADDSAGRHPSAVAAPSETDAELSAMLLRAAKEIGLEVPKMVSGEGSCGAAALSLSAFLPGASGYEAVPQVERAVAVHLCPRGAATWRDRPHLPSKACKFSSALAGRTYHTAGQAATALHAMATLQVYQAKVLKHLHERGSDQGAMEELRAATDFALRATKVTAHSLGQVMSTIVVQERHLWLTLAQMADIDKSWFLYAPISQGGLFGDTVEDFAQQFSAVQKQTEAIKHILPRRDIPTTAPPRGFKETTSSRPLLRCMTPDWQPDVELPAGERRRPRLRDRSPAKDLRSVPDVGNPKVERIALWGTTTSTSSLPVEGRELLCAQTLPTKSQKESFLSPPGFRPRVPSLSSAQEVSPRIRTRSLMSPAREPGKKVSAAQCSLTFLQDVLPSGISPLPLPLPLPPGCPTAVTSVNVPLIPLATRLGAWLQLPSPSRWLIRTVRLGYAIQFARRPPRYRGVLSTSVHCRGSAYQYKVLPFGLSLSPCVFTEAALSPLWQTVQRISFLGVELDSVSMTARLTNERAQSVLKCLESFRHKTVVPLKTFQRLLGHMAAAAAVTPLGLLHMRPLQRWLHDRVPRWAWHRGTLRIGVSPQCCRLFSPWSDPAFLQAGVPLGQVSRHLVVYTDASSTDWGAVCNGQAASGSWTGPRLQWHINCLELLAVLLALCRFRPRLRHKHMLVRTDSTATVAYINHQGGLRSRCMSQLARHLLLWCQTWLKSLRAVHIPGELNRAADQLSISPPILENGDSTPRQSS